MEKLTNSYLINKLEDGNNLNIVLLSHNTYWPEIQKIDNNFENCNVVVLGSSTSYIKLADIQSRNQIENSDLIIFYSSEYYNEQELAELEDIAFRISTDKNKRVSIGYLYCLPIEQRPHASISKQIQIISFKNEEEVIETTYPTPYFSTSDLTALTLVVADNYDIIKQQKLEKKL